MKTSNTVLSAVIGSVLGLSATLGAPQAYADQKVYPGSACDIADPSQSPDFYKGNGAIWNRGNGFFDVSCPIVRDNVSNGNGVRRAIVRVYNNNNNLSHESVRCSLAAVNAHGQFIKSRSARATTNGVVNLEVGVNASSVLGLYHIECTLPERGVVPEPPSGVLNYWIDEYDGD